MKEILENTLFFTHGGRLSALYGILATETLSSNKALEKSGEDVFKFTDPENKYQQEDGYLFFESIADRGRINYSGLVDFKSNEVGFAFLLVASSQSLLKQVDMLGNSDGVLMGRLDGNPLEIDLKKVDYKIIIPESYQENIKEYCQTLKDLGINPPENKFVFKPMKEIQDILKSQPEKSLMDRQKEFCKEIDLNAQKSDKTFTENEKIIETKTSKIKTSCDKELQKVDNDKLKPKEFLNGHDLVNHMKSKPTPGNLQRNSMLLFLEHTSSPLKKSILNLSNKRPMILDLIDKPEDLSFALNCLANTHYSQEVTNNGEKRISSYVINNVIERINNTEEKIYIKNAMNKCLEIIKDRNITKEECLSIIETYKENQWFVAINRVQQNYCMSDKNVKELLKNHSNEILLWKEGMTEWKHGFEIFPPVIEPPPLNEVIKNITDLRKNNEINNDKKLKP